ncbi:uncharacterized protein LOC144361784 [Saccoglossus kowalevskii]
MCNNNTGSDPVSDNIGVHNIVDINNYNKPDKLLRITVYVLRFVNKLKRSSNNNNVQLSPEEINMAEKKWVTDLQRTNYGDVVHSLQIRDQLNLFLDNEDTLRCGSRIHNAPLDFVTKFPALLPPHHKFTNCESS